ncbi:hypothetical protein C8R43DRAFT_904377, partial [Mycena crocata]
EDEDEDQGHKRARRRDHTEYSCQWFPWSDKITCTLDVLMHLPRSVFSHRQLELFIWLLKVNNVDDVPSVKSMQELNTMLQKLCGIQSIPYDGALGHKYYVNSLAQIIAQAIRPHLRFYPEDSGSLLEEARQGQRWLHEIPAEQTTPMARIGGRDYFLYEPAMLTNGTFCVPFRWFSRGAILFAKCWDLTPVNTEHGRKWRVIQSEAEFSQDKFMKNLPDLHMDYDLYDVPPPSSIAEILDPVEGTLSKWTLTDPAIGNSWRERAKGSPVYAFPIWLYCDDTSGNLSKKWNEHNSFLFTPAGLPREQAQKEFNIHFLSTSNIAPPLEMLDGIIDQLEEAQKDGIWAWDCHAQELVLIIPTVLALLGDNPMQSEFACHISLKGKYFCRACWVKGSDALDEVAEKLPDAGAVGGDSDADSQADTDAASNASQNSGSEAGGKKSRGKRAKETLAQTMQRIKAFVKIGRPRTKEETTGQLRSYFDQATTLNTKTKVKEMRTASGIKDTFQLVFLEKLFNSYQKKRGRKARQDALDAQRQRLPEKTSSPVWRIQGLDPHRDTPVKILHVILLGFVKYMWRDLVQNQLKDKNELKALLVTRLNSFDVSGLGISPLAGHTLVQYSGSLVGRDFRAIAQAAPFVAYDLVSKDCLATWVALSKLIPLIWQPSIKNVEAHAALLTAEINHFLTCAARWTTRWFNKPKFHIFLHLPEHIRRFGPAILFATEAFESFNAIIRAKSVHSNRHTPSRDIAQAFAQGNRIRHLLSGGVFMQLSASDATQHLSRERCHWTSAGPGPLSLVSSPNTVTQYLGLENKKRGTRGKLPQSFPNPAAQIKTNTAVFLDNGDLCKLGQFVVVKPPNETTTFIARVKEILQLKDSPDDYSRKPSAILLQSVELARTPHSSYGMPTIELKDQWSVVRLADILCTVNVQHDCSTHGCAPSGFQRIYQERQATEHTKPAIVHAAPMDDLVLNTAQMRDAADLQPFRINSPDLDANAVIEASIVREFNQRKAAAAQAAAAAVAAGEPNTASGVGQGRGRGRGRGRGLVLPARSLLSFACDVPLRGPRGRSFAAGLAFVRSRPAFRSFVRSRLGLRSFGVTDSAFVLDWVGGGGRVQKKCCGHTV